MHCVLHSLMYLVLQSSDFFLGLHILQERP